MTDPSSNDRDLARQLVDELLDPDIREVESPEGVVLSDLEEDVEDFLSDLRWLRLVQLDVPAVSFGGSVVPVALSCLDPSGIRLGESAGTDSLSPGPSSSIGRELEKRLLRSFDASSKAELVPHEKARASFFDRSVEFMATRVAALRSLGATWRAGGDVRLPERLGGSPASIPGCAFDVMTNSPGLRVFWSGAYRISPRYFAAPTTPASSVLQSGTYVFGVDGGAYGSTIRWDHNAVITLPGPQAAVRLNY